MNPANVDTDVVAMGTIQARSTVPRFLCLCALTLLAAQLVLAPAPTQAQLIRPARLLQTTEPEERLTVEMVEAQRKEAAESTDLDDEAKQEADNHYKFVVDALQKMTELAIAAAQFQQDTDDVQQRVDELRTHLDDLQGLKPTLPELATLAELEQEQAKRNLQLTDLKSMLARVEAEPTTRANRLKEIRGLLLSASQRIADINKQLATPPPTDEPKLLTQARLAELRTRLQLIETELPALQNELAKYDAEDSADFVRVERDVRTQQVALAEAELKLFDDEIDRLRAIAKAEALQRARDEAIAAQPLLQADADLNRLLAEKAVGLTEPLNQAKSKLESTQKTLEGLQKQFTTTQQKVEGIGLTGAVGSLLRRQKSDLPDLVQRKSNVRDRRAVIEKAQYDLFDYDDQRRDLATRDPLVQQILDSASAGMAEAERIQLEDAARDVLDRRAEYLDQLIRSYNTWLDTLFELDETEQLLIAETERYTTYIDERVLWIRSNDTLFAKIALDKSDGWLLASRRWVELGAQLLADMQANLWLYAVAAAAFATLILLKPRTYRALSAAGRMAMPGNCTSFRPTLDATWLTLLMTVVWPGAVWFLAVRLASVADSSEFNAAVAHGLMAVAWGYLPVEALLKICRRDGLADHHFDWPDSTIRLFRRTVPGLAACGLPLAFVTATLYASDPEHGLDFVERACFVAATVVLALFLQRVMRPDTGILNEYLTAHPEGWIARLRLPLYWSTVLSPLCLAGLTIAGYYYTAQQLAWRLFATILFVFSLQLVRALLQRLLIVERRKLTIEQAHERNAELVARQEAATTPADSDVDATTAPTAVVPQEELRADVERNTEQSRRLLSMSLTVTSLVGVWMIWFDVLPALHILDQWPLWTTRVEVTADESSLSTSPGHSMSGTAAGDVPESQSSLKTITVLRPVTPRDVGLAILLAIVTFACARNIPGLMEMWVLQRLPFDQSVRYAITTLTRYAIILLGIIVSFNAISVGWSKVQWLATALTFGLAFGVQEIFANFVAGLILLFERPIRVGDVVTVDDVSGVVSRIRIRATTITNWDRKEYVIPNKEFITGRMLNWTLSDKVNRVVINVGIAYGSDVSRAKELLVMVCRDHPLILTDPGPGVTFEGFGDNTLNLVLRSYLPDLDNRLGVIDALHSNIDRVFREAGIEIAFPQHDLHLRSIDDAAVRALRGGGPGDRPGTSAA
jgi:potassium efflux system protein